MLWEPVLWEAQKDAPKSDKLISRDSPSGDHCFEPPLARTLQHPHASTKLLLLTIFFNTFHRSQWTHDDSWIIVFVHFQRSVPSCRCLNFLFVRSTSRGPTSPSGTTTRANFFQAKTDIPCLLPSLATVFRTCLHLTRQTQHVSCSETRRTTVHLTQRAICTRLKTVSQSYSVESTHSTRYDTSRHKTSP